MEGMIGEIRGFGGNFAPRAWALCQGQLLPISANTALFSILGTTYGGDGRTTFALPDFRGRTIVGQGHGPGLSARPLGQKGGTETNTLNITQMPAHNHAATGTVTPLANTGEGEETNPANAFPANSGEDQYAENANTVMGSSNLSITLGQTGGNQPFNNIQPFQVINIIICMQGVYPSRS